MNILLDTHSFLWAIWGDPRLSSDAAAAFLNPRNTLHFSMVSYWEICIKHALGKLDLAGNWPRVFDNEMATNGIRWLALKKEHCLGIIDLPAVHSDPFDRLLIAQAQFEGLTIVTKDTHIAQYQIETFW